MFETLYTCQRVLARHRASPYAESRARYLVHCSELGYPRTTLRKFAWVLEVISHSMNLCKPGQVTHQEIEFAVDHRVRINGSKRNEGSRRLFIHIATAWLRFTGNLAEPHALQKPFAHYIDDYARFMSDQRGLSPVTIKNYCEEIANFLAIVWRPDISLRAITIKDVDVYLAYQGNHGWSRASLHELASALRVFFRYAEGQGWANGVAAGIEAPRIYAQEGLPLGPTWQDVQKIIASFSGNNASDIRNRAIVLLLAIYGLRRGEVARLCLDDLDWVGEILHVSRPKQRCAQQYPLIPLVGDAILRYLKESRPRSSHRELFLTREAPVRPLQAGGISSIVRARLKAIDIQPPRRGSHCLRHACARHLLDAGFTLKEIGDHLGHRSATATRIYAKVDLNSLRDVAELELGGLL
jgi:site-specific recombinase XerD